MIFQIPSLHVMPSLVAGGDDRTKVVDVPHPISGSARLRRFR